MTDILFNSSEIRRVRISTEAGAYTSPIELHAAIESTGNVLLHSISLKGKPKKFELTVQELRDILAEVDAFELYRAYCARVMHNAEMLVKDTGVSFSREDGGHTIFKHSDSYYDIPLFKNVAIDELLSKLKEAIQAEKEEQEEKEKSELAKLEMEAVTLASHFDADIIETDEKALYDLRFNEDALARLNMYGFPITRILLHLQNMEVFTGIGGGKLENYPN